MTQGASLFRGRTFHLPVRYDVASESNTRMADATKVGDASNSFE